jgi:hypothetical protein
MILTVTGFLCFAWFTSVPGMIMGKMEIDEIRAGRAPQEGKFFAQIGFYGGILVSLFWCVMTPLFFLFLPFFGF